MGKYKEDLGLALEMAGYADVVTMHRFESGDLTVKDKPDMSPVSDADLACEKKIREALKKCRPRDEVLGEEYGGGSCFSGRQWVIDPIDGTRNFVRGVPVWATLISLLEDGEPVVCVISAPALRRRWYAAKGSGAFRVFGGEPKRLRVSGVSSLADASLGISSLSGWVDHGLRDEVVKLSEDSWRLRGYGDFWNYCLVAEGAVDVAAEPDVSLWDLAAPSLLVCEAGGKFTNVEGKPGPHGGSAVASNGLIHNDILDRFHPEGAQRRAAARSVARPASELLAD